MPLPDFPELTGPAWQRASAGLLLTVLAEYAYEDLLTPVPDEDAARPDGRYRLELAGHVVYSFRARRGAFGSWRIQPGSVLRVADGAAAPATDPARLIVDARADLGLTAEATARLVRDVSVALLGAARDDARDRPTAAELADLAYLDLEGRVGGRPGLVPDRVRPGFSATDASRWAPEARNPIRLPWAAVHRDIATWHTSTPDLTEQRLRTEELDPSTRRRFTARLRDRGADPADYLWLPVHPWQWDETVLPLFAADLAHGLLVPLGDGGPDRYLPRQAGGGFTNLDRPGRRDVALPLAGPDAPLGCPVPAPAAVSPDITRRLVDRYHADPFLHGETRVLLLADLASVAVRHPHLDPVRGESGGHPYRGLLGALWSEPLAARLDTGERARPLPALLHRDHTGRPLVAELVARSGLAPREWLRWLCSAVLPPLLHLLYRYGLAFPSYGEALVVVSDAGEVPVRLAVRDVARGLLVCGDPDGTPFPEAEGLAPEMAEDPGPGPEFAPRRAAARYTAADLGALVGGGLFGGPLRHLSAIADDDLGVPEAVFWSLVRAEVTRYQQRFPELKERYPRFDLLGPRLARHTPNRDRLPRQRSGPPELLPSPLHGPEA
ncbi:IucA/IucC family protein [Yinghuangia soli]|uniref:IucA/IucC family siderophore biosynthesis protein n=1 Tax=Yinghuangia soli TaxID=2908204 RepID=A0AA41U1N9_9ACTN|nr:IucA/IucC family protein [Yinghuangia soli]MCF2526319.1 IucA/IucC family siderophore biosynthesis protein [Yinghuangia soli]